MRLHPLPPTTTLQNIRNSSPFSNATSNTWDKDSRNVNISIARQSVGEDLLPSPPIVSPALPHENTLRSPPPDKSFQSASHMNENYISGASFENEESDNNLNKIGIVSHLTESGVRKVKRNFCGTDIKSLKQDIQDSMSKRSHIKLFQGHISKKLNENEVGDYFVEHFTMSNRVTCHVNVLSDNDTKITIGNDDKDNNKTQPRRLNSEIFDKKTPKNYYSLNNQVNPHDIESKKLESTSRDTGKTDFQQSSHVMSNNLIVHRKENDVSSQALTQQIQSLLSHPETKHNDFYCNIPSTKRVSTIINTAPHDFQSPQQGKKYDIDELMQQAQNLQYQIKLQQNKIQTESIIQIITESTQALTFQIDAKRRLGTSNVNKTSDTSKEKFSNHETDMLTQQSEKIQSSVQHKRQVLETKIAVMEEKLKQSKQEVIKTHKLSQKLHEMIKAEREEFYTIFEDIKLKLISMKRDSNASLMEVLARLATSQYEVMKLKEENAAFESQTKTSTEKKWSIKTKLTHRENECLLMNKEIGKYQIDIQDLQCKVKEMKKKLCHMEESQSNAKHDFDKYLDERDKLLNAAISNRVEGRDLQIRELKSENRYLQEQVNNVKQTVEDYRMLTKKLVNELVDMQSKLEYFNQEEKIRWTDVINVFDENQVEKKNIMKIIHEKEKKQRQEGKEAQEEDLRKNNNANVGKKDAVENDIEKNKIKEYHGESGDRKNNDTVHEEYCTVIDDGAPFNAYDQFVHYEKTYPKSTEQPTKIFAQLGKYYKNINKQFGSRMGELSCEADTTLPPSGKNIRQIFNEKVVVQMKKVGLECQTDTTDSLSSNKVNIDDFGNKVKARLGLDMMDIASSSGDDSEGPGINIDSTIRPRPWATSNVLSSRSPSPNTIQNSNLRQNRHPSPLSKVKKNISATKKICLSPQMKNKDIRKSNN